MTSTPEFSTMHAGAGRLVSLTDSGLDRLDQQTRKGETGITPRTFLRNDDRLRVSCCQRASWRSTLDLMRY
jgi:hypothetical protein